MATRDMFTLDTPLAPKMVRILYGIAFALIVLGTLIGVGRGIARMTHEPRPRAPLMADRAPAPSQQAANPSPDAPPSAQAPTPRTGMANTDGMRMRGMMGYGMPGPHMRGMRGFEPGMHRGGMRRFGHRGGPGLMGRQPPAVMGAIQILRALVMGAIGLLVVRILAEVALSLLAMLRRAAATA
jgi:hypothetical protein